MKKMRPVGIVAGILSSLLLQGCGASANEVLPVIVTEPSSATVPVGQAAVFSVIATGGEPLSYQWLENGSPIAGAVSASLTTQPVAAADANETFQVTVSNSAGSVESTVVTLEVGPRSPKLGDLRFQQVDAPSTVNGYASILTVNFSGNETDEWTNDAGAPMSVGWGCAGQWQGECAWDEQVNNLPPGVTGLSTFYGNGGVYADLTSGLAAMEQPRTVITGLNVEESANAYGMSYMTATAGGTFDHGNFDFVASTVPVSGLSAAIAAEGLKSRVVTAITWNGDQVTFLSYGWTGDTSTTYDTMVVPASYPTVGQVAEQLAGEGYIITACGGDNTVSNLWMVGTKVTGDSLPRPILLWNYDQSSELMLTEGYAMVGYFVGPAVEDLWWIGER